MSYEDQPPYDASRFWTPIDATQAWYPGQPPLGRAQQSVGQYFEPISPQRAGTHPAYDVYGQGGPYLGPPQPYLPPSQPHNHNGLHQGSPQAFAHPGGFYG